MVQHDAAAMGAVGFAQVRAGAVTLRRPSDVGGGETLVDGETFRAEGGDQAVARQAESRVLVLEAELVERGRRTLGRLYEWPHAGQVGQAATQSLRVAPAMAANVTDRLWSLEELVERTSQ